MQGGLGQVRSGQGNTFSTLGFCLKYLAENYSDQGCLSSLECVTHDNV